MVTPRANPPFAPLSNATVSNFAGIDLEAKISKNTGLGFGLRKICGLGLVLGRMGLNHSPWYLNLP